MEKKKNLVICWRMGKTYCKAKTPPGEFKVITPKNLLINNQVVTSMRNLTITLTYSKIPIYNWTFTLIPNWIWFCSRLLYFAQISNWLQLCMNPSMWLTPATWLIDCCWLQSSSLHKRWRSGTTWLQNPKVYKHNSFTQSIWVLCLCFRYLMNFKISLIYD